MTVTYTGEVASCTGLGCFWRLLFRWRGSIYKLLWQNLLVYSVLYFSLSIIYRFLLDEHQRILFEKTSLHCQVYGDLIPVSFVLGFYVSLVIKRWWDQYLCLPWPDNLALFVSALIHGQNDRGRMIRRTVMRYANLSVLLTLRMISPGVKKRFPTLDHVVEAGWMLIGELTIFEDLERKTAHAKYWMPLVWAGGIISRARQEGLIHDDFSVKTLVDELNKLRDGCGGMLNYDWISIPLVYTQVVTLAVYIYFLSTLMANQFLDPAKNYPKHEVDLIVPVFTFLQISYVIVDEMHQEHPEMLRDQYWDEVFPAELPYTAASKQYQTGPPTHSAEPVVVAEHEAEFMPLDECDSATVTALDAENARAGAEATTVTVTQQQPIRRVGGITRGRCASATASVASRSTTTWSAGRSRSALNIITRWLPSREQIFVVSRGSSSSIRPPSVHSSYNEQDDHLYLSDLNLENRRMSLSPRGETSVDLFV